MSPYDLAKQMRFYYGGKWLSWEPDVMEATLERKFNQDLDAEDIEEIEATREVLRADRFAFEPLIFEKCVRAFNGLPVTTSAWEPVKPHHLAYGLYVMRRLVGTGPLGMDGMGGQVRGYIATILAMAPIGYAPSHYGFHPATKDLRRLLHVPEARSITKEVWASILDPAPELPEQLYRRVKSRFVPSGTEEDDLSPPRRSAYHYTARLAFIWEYLHDRDAAPTTNPYTSTD